MSLKKLLDKFIEKVDPEWKLIHQIADKNTTKLVDAYVEAFRQLQLSIDVEWLVAVGDVRLYPQHIQWSVFEKNLDKVYKIISSILVEAADVTVKKLDSSSFNIRNPRAVKWAVDHVGENIRQVDAETQKAVQSIINDALKYGGNPKETAKQIQQFIGLTQRQIASILRYQERLDYSGRSEAAVNSMVDSRIRRMVKERALTIARTETIAAACGGQQLHWEDMLDKGFIKREELVKTWITTPDDKLCPSCSAMNGQITEIDAVFGFGGKTPPLHPKCRCAIGLVERPGYELSTYQNRDWSKIDSLIGGK